jgi:hypothetical protein
MYETRSHIVYNGVLNHETRRFLAMPLNSAGFKIAFNTVASNTYASIIV